MQSNPQFGMLVGYTAIEHWLCDACEYGSRRASHLGESCPLRKPQIEVPAAGDGRRWPADKLNDVGHSMLSGTCVQRGTGGALTSPQCSTLPWFCENSLLSWCGLSYCMDRQYLIKSSDEDIAYSPGAHYMVEMGWQTQSIASPSLQRSKCLQYRTQNGIRFVICR